jgi:AcrR family transcriptional regulator
MSTANPQRARKDQVRNREALLAAAWEVFAEYGLDAPLDVVAKRAGLGNATLYRHFPQRLDLIVELLMITLARNKAALAEALSRPSAWEGLTAYLEWIFAEQIANPAYLSALRAVPAGENTEVDELRATTLAQLEQLIARAKADGLLRTDRWIEDVFLLCGLNEQLARAGHRDPVSASQRFLDLSLAALASDPAPAPRRPSPPKTVQSLRRTLGHEVAGLPDQESPT